MITLRNKFSHGFAFGVILFFALLGIEQLAQKLPGIPAIIHQIMLALMAVLFVISAFFIIFTKKDGERSLDPFARGGLCGYITPPVVGIVVTIVLSLTS